MGTYGFKLLEIQLFRGNGSIKQDFGNTKVEKGKKAADEAPVHYLDRVMADFAPDLEPGAVQEFDDGGSVDADSNEETVTTVDVGSDDVVADDEPDSGANPQSKQLAVVRIESATRYQGAVLLETVYGIVGDYRKAVDPAGVREDADLTNLATTRTYRALIIAPQQGPNGLLAVEVVSRSHAARRLPNRLLQGAKGHNFKIRTFGAIADDSSVRDLMEGATIQAVNLFQTISSEDSARPRTIPAVLTFKIGKGSPEESTLKQKVLPWLPTRANKAKKSKPDPAAEANSLASWLWPAIASDAHFETAEVVVKGKNRTKRLKPLDMAEGFTYDLGDVRPDDDNFVASVADVVNSISATNQLNLEDGWESPLR